MLSIGLRVEPNEPDRIVADFDLQTAAAIVAAVYVIDNHAIICQDVAWENEEDRLHFYTFASAIKAYFDLLEVTPE